MKETVESTIAEAIGKLDSSFLLLLLPCLLAIYICIYVDDSTIDQWLGNPTEQKIEVTCPHCGETFIYTITQKENEPQQEGF